MHVLIDCVEQEWRADTHVLFTYRKALPYKRRRVYVYMHVIDTLLCDLSITTQEGDSLRDAVKGVATAQPCIIIRGRLNSVKDAVLVVEKEAEQLFLQSNHP